MEFTKEQREAIEAPKNVNQAIIARAGAGKTTVAAARINYLIRAGVDPRSILALTFTKAGGTQLQSKCEARLGYAGTLHAYALKTLGIDPANVLSEAEEAEFLTQILTESRVKTISAGQFKTAMTAPVRPVGDIGLLFRMARTRLDSMGKTTFDFVLHEFLAFVQTKIHEGSPGQCVLVDEAQDTSPIDAAIFRALAEGFQGRIIAIGDPAQAIYAFRGATSNFLNSVARRGVKTPLSESFRCCPEICEAASRLLSPGEYFYSASRGKGAVADFVLQTQREMEDWLFMAASTSVKDGLSIAILARYNATVDAIRRAFASANIHVEKRLGARQEMSQAAAMARFLRAHVEGNLEALVAAHPLPKAFQKKWPVPAEYWTRTEALNNVGTLFAQSAVPPEWMEHGAIAEHTPRQALEALVLGQGAPADDSRGIHIETIHGAKGREWDRVILAGADSSLDRDPDGQAGNLLYVACTRARRDFATCHSKQTVNREGMPVAAKPSALVSRLMTAQA